MKMSTVDYKLCCCIHLLVGTNVLEEHSAFILNQLNPFHIFTLCLRHILILFYVFQEAASP
jgi:hypothetical protein